MSENSDQGGLPLHNAASAMGVKFTKEFEPRDRTVEANGLTFHYLEWGDPSNPAALLLHGFAQTCHSWDFISLSLADRFHVHALDQRGHGDSSWAPDGDYSPETQQTDIHGVVEALDLRDFLLMGLSMGGRNSFTYAALHPERVKALVVVDAAPENMADWWAEHQALRSGRRRVAVGRVVRGQSSGVQPAPRSQPSAGEHTSQPEAASKRQMDLEVRQASQEFEPPTQRRRRTFRAAVELPRATEVPYPSRARKSQRYRRAEHVRGDVEPDSSRASRNGRECGAHRPGRQPGRVPGSGA